jgi:hypothetical protein
MGKTGGGPGTNQYQIRGQAKTRLPDTIAGYPADQVSVRGDCVWPQSGPDDLWCLTHRQVAPELRELVGLAPCVTKLSSRAQSRLVRALPTAALGSWVSQLADADLRMYAASVMPLNQLGWAAQDKNKRVRRAAAQRMPVDQLQWAAQDDTPCRLIWRCDAALATP